MKIKKIIPFIGFYLLFFIVIFSCFSQTIFADCLQSGSPCAQDSDCCPQQTGNYCVGTALRSIPRCLPKSQSFTATTPTPTPTAFPPNPCPSQNGICTNIPTALGPIDVSGPGQFIKTLFELVLSLSGGVAIILILISGYRLMITQGDPERTKAAREMLTSAIIGLLFVIFSVTILQVLGVDILRLPGFSNH